VLSSLGATVHVGDATGNRRDIAVRDFFTGYRKVAMKPDELVLSITIPLTAEGVYCAAFKQSRRREDDIAIVNAGMRVVLDPPPERGTGTVPVVKDIELSFGGMAATTISAPKTQRALIGLPWSRSTLDTAIESLKTELLLPVGVRSKDPLPQKKSQEMFV
jgi:xanthine dehydrogenase/oxidase